MDSFDPMAVAIDWLEAYRAEDIDALLSLYDEAAALECGCGGDKKYAGKAALRAYWEVRLKEKPCSEIEELLPTDRGVSLAYRTQRGLVHVVLNYDARGKILKSKCGPTLG